MQSLRYFYYLIFSQLLNKNMIAKINTIFIQKEQKSTVTFVIIYMIMVSLSLNSQKSFEFKRNPSYFFSFNLFPFWRFYIIQMKAIILVALVLLFLAQNTNSQTGNPPQTPQAISAILGKGFDVAWSQFLQKSKRYNRTLPDMIAAAGFSNVRIRVNQDYPNATWLGNLSRQVNDSLVAQLIPIIAHQLGIIQTGVFTTFQQDVDYICSAWGNFTTYFKGYSYKLLFNIWVELSGKYGNNITALNSIYSEVIKKIRSIDSSRMIIVSPIKLSDPDYLKNLTLPADDYLMVEWHFYASGPSKDVTKPKYWIDGNTKIERDNILTSIQTAVDWMASSGKKTWVGAWMAGNYNKGNNYTVQEQVGFASFMARSLSLYNIPWSINTDDKFIDFDNKTWFQRTQDAAGIPVRDTILNPNQISLYENQTYGGKGFRLSPGYYDSTQLAGIQFTNAKSIMVPIDFKVTLYNQTGFSGSSVFYYSTNRTLNSFSIKSLIVEYLPKIFV